MSRTMAILGSALFFVVAPLMVAGLVPWLVTHWEFQAPFGGVELTRVAGTRVDHRRSPRTPGFVRALCGPGDWHPRADRANRELWYVTGLYRHVRNPMYVAVVAIVLGQAALFGNGLLLWYGTLLWLAFHIFVVAYEEPTLRQTFGAEYEDYRGNVPRWIPRLTAGKYAKPPA